jgi:hypothetical protein
MFVIKEVNVYGKKEITWGRKTDETLTFIANKHGACNRQRAFANNECKPAGYRW